MNGYRLSTYRVRFLWLVLIALTPVVQVRAEDPPPFVPGSWTMVLLPDTQRYTAPGLTTFSNITQWIADNKGTRNIQFVQHEGDITGGNTAATWQVASNAMAVLDNAGVAYSMTTGNHDHDQWIPVHQNSPSRDTLMNDYFPVSRYQAMPTFGGVFELGKTQNNYHLFSAGGKDYISIALEWGPRNESVAWADTLLTQHANRTALITTHAYTYTDGTRYDWAKKGTSQIYNPHCESYGFSAPHDGSENVNDGQQLWDKLISKHANASMVFSGHLPWAGARQTAIGDHGQSVHEMLAAYHDPCDGPTTGYVRLLEFQPDGRTVQVKTYSPHLDQSMTDDDHQFVVYTAPLPSAKIFVATRSSASGVVALDHQGNKVGSIIPDKNGGSGYDVIDVVQMGFGGEFAMSEHRPGHRVGRYDDCGNFLDAYADTPAGDISAGALAMADGKLFTNYNSVAAHGSEGAIARLDPETGQQEDILYLGTHRPRGLTVGPDGSLYMSANGAGILKIAQDFSSSSVFADNEIDEFADLTFGPDGDLYVATYTGDAVKRYDGTTGTLIDTFVTPGLGGLDLATGLMFHPVTGNLLVGSFNTNQILEYDGITGAYLGEFASVDQPWMFSSAAIPEPTMMALMAFGWAGVFLRRNRRQHVTDVV